MDSNIMIKHQRKFVLLLNEFLKNEYKVSNDVYLEMLLTHLSGKKEYVYTELIHSPEVLKWIAESVKRLENNSPPLNNLIIAFTIRLIGIAMEVEWVFIAFYEQKLFDSIQNSLANETTKILTPSVKLANVFLMKSLLKHSIGLHWIKRTQAWKVILEYVKENQTVYVVRESIEFINDFLFKIITQLNDEQLSTEVLQEIVRPIQENVYDKQSGIVFVDNCDIQRKVLPALNLISFILEKVIENKVKTKIPHHLHESFQTRVNLWQLLEMTQDKIFFSKIMRVHVFLNVATLSEMLVMSASSTTPVNFNQFGVYFFNHMRVCLVRQRPEAFLSVANLYNILWYSLGERAPIEIELENYKVKFENQVILMQVMPILMVVTKQTTIDSELIFDAYTTKLVNMASEHTMRICYSLRDLLRSEKAQKDDIACKAIQGILAMKRSLHRDRSVIVFQALVYSIKTREDRSLNDDQVLNGTNNASQLPPNLLSAILTALSEIIKTYRLTWKESIESVCVLNIMLDLLDAGSLSSRISVQALQIIQLSLEHSLVPNMALLVNTLQRSGMEHLGPMILKRLHDNHWEVRDSTLELLTSMVVISELKFSAFQQHILDNGLCPIVVSIAKHDQEPFVRASAFKCLCSMVNIKLFWDRCLNSMDLIVTALELISTESEGIVRKEAIHLINEIFFHQTISKSHLNQLYSTLAYSTVNDLYWEVKTCALQFWKSVIHLQFQHQGMIDGTFPTVTFSKEQKKIVTLTPNEITLRLTKILNELSTRGCLGILLTCIDDDCDLEVAKVAAGIITELSHILDTYNYKIEKHTNGVSSDNVISHNKLPTTQNTLNVQASSSSSSESQCVNVINDDNITNASDVTSIKINDDDICMEDLNESIPNSDNIIESIVSAHDINLLAASYENQLNLIDGKIQNTIDHQYYRTFANVSPNDFINKIIEIDVNEKVNQRTNWIMKTESFGSLLDDMLYSMQVLDVNEADCY